MTKFFCFAGLLWLATVAGLEAQSAPPAGMAASDREARIAERYQAMLTANPVEGMALDRLWKFHEDHGTTSALVETYRKANDGPGATAATALVYGHLLKKTGRSGEADAAYQLAAERDPANPLPLAARADLAVAQRDPRRAALAFAEAIKLTKDGDRRRVDLFMKQGNAWLAAGETARAAESWEKLVALNPEDLAVRRRLAEVYEENGLLGRAITQEEFVEAHAGPAERATALRELGRMHEARGEFEAARDALERGINLTARDNWLHTGLQTQLIQLHQRAGRVPELLARWREAVRQAPRDLEGYFRLAALAGTEGDAAGEREERAHIAALAPNDRANSARLAAQYANGGELARAARLYDDLLKTQPDNLDLLLARADLDVQSGDLEPATRRLEARLKEPGGDEAASTAVLNFLLTHHLDAAAERLLRAEIARFPLATEHTVALVKFLFAHRRPSEADAVLRDLSDAPGDAVSRANRLGQAADAYKEGGMPQEAIRCWEQLARLRPNDPAPLLAAAEILRARNDQAGVVNLLRRAVLAAAATADQTNVERKLFEALQADSTPQADGLSVPAATAIATGTPPAGTPASSLAGYFADLEAQVRNEPSLENELRLARWYSWAHEGVKAIEAANAALRLEPTSIPGRELIVAVAVDLHRDELAEKMLNQIVELDPSREEGVLRQLAKLKLQSGDNDGSLKLFAKLADLNPGSRAALSDLALAHQRMDRWFDALATQERLYALPGTTPAQRAETRRALVATYDHLGQHGRVVDLLFAAAEEQTEPSAKEDLIHQAAEIALQHDLGAELRGKLEGRLRSRPDDYLLLTALAQISRETGEPEEAYHLLQRARYSSPDPARTLPVLVRDGEALGEIDEAVANQTRLVALPGQFTPENLQRLTDLQEEAQDPGTATLTWNSVVAHFPRDPAVLAKASQFFERTSQTLRARDLLRQVVGLDEADLSRFVHLATLDARLNDPGAALLDYTAVLDRTAAETPGSAWYPPDELILPPNSMFTAFSGTVRARLRTPDPPVSTPPAVPKLPTADQALRFQAIREISRLLTADKRNPSPVDPQAREAWLSRWQKAANAGVRNEPWYAFYYSGQVRRTMDWLEKWLSEKTDDPGLRQTFLAAGLRLADYDTIGRWVWKDGPEAERETRVSAFVATLDQYLGTGGRPAPGMVAALFPTATLRDDLLWDMAKEFAALHWYAPAAELGQRLIKATSNARATRVADVVEWELYNGSVEAARDAAQLALDEGRGWSLETTASPVFATLRERYLLTPEPEREAFAADYLQRMRDRGDPLHATLSGVLLHGLAGDETAARRDLDELLATRTMASENNAPSTDARRWQYVLANGLQLRSWGLDRLAVYLWSRALKEATAFDEHFGDGENTVTEIRRRLLCAQVAVAADPEEERECVEDYLSAAPPAGPLASLAGELLNDSRSAAARQIYEHICRVEPNDREHWRRLFATYDQTGQDDRLEQSLENLVRGNAKVPDDFPRSDLVGRWAATRERNGDVEGACQVLKTECANTPGNPGMLAQLAQTEERAGRYERAAEVWREAIPFTPGPAAILGLAGAMEKQGRRDEATRLLLAAQDHALRDGQGEVAVNLVKLYLADGKTNEAVKLAKSLLRDGKTEALPTIAASFVEGGQTAAVRQLLTAALGKLRDSGARFRLQQTLVGLSKSSGDDRRSFLRQMAQLEVIVRETPALRGNWEAIRYKLARQAGADDWLEGELGRLWDGGKGEYLAGERLATFYIETHQNQRLRETIGEFDHRPLLPDQLLFGLENALLRADHAGLALPISERLCRRFPQNADYTLARALVLWKSGQRDGADRLLGVLTAQAVLRPELLERVAMFYQGVGEKEQATRCFESIARRDPTATRSPGSFLQLARLYLDAGRAADAEAPLRVAYRQDACDDLHPLVDYLVASKQLEGDKALEMPLPDFPLSFQRRAALIANVYGYLKTTGRSESALRLWLRHPEFLAEAPSAALELVATSTVPQLPELVDCLRIAVNQNAAPTPRLLRALAAGEARLNRENHAAQTIDRPPSACRSLAAK